MPIDLSLFSYEQNFFSCRLTFFFISFRFISFHFHYSLRCRRSIVHQFIPHSSLYSLCLIFFHLVIEYFQLESADFFVHFNKIFDWETFVFLFILSDIYSSYTKWTRINFAYIIVDSKLKDDNIRRNRRKFFINYELFIE